LLTLSEFVDWLASANPGRCPGLEFANAFGVGESIMFIPSQSLALGLSMSAASPLVLRELLRKKSFLAKAQRKTRGAKNK
jgi:hypothetical protein